MVSPKPIVVVSRCLGFDACRYNAQTVRDTFLPALGQCCELRLVCPEVEIGLGVPRDPVRLVMRDHRLRLLQPASGRDVTVDMEGFSARYLDSLDAVDGFVLKGRSPSCGVTDARIYPDREKTPALGRSPGLFAGAVLERFPYAAIEDEGRLQNLRIREHFLSKLFARARFRGLKARPSRSDLVRFHTTHKLILMAYNQKEMRALGRIVADLKRRPIEDAIRDYESHLAAALSRLPRFTSHVNVLMHAFGYFSRQLGGREKAHFLELLDAYRSGRLPLSAAVAVLRSWIHRFGSDYLGDQVYFEPFPAALVDIRDSGKGR